ALQIAELADEIWIEISSRFAHALNCFCAARLVVGNQWLTIIDSHRQIKHDGIGKSVAPFRGQIALENVVAIMTRRCLTRNETEEQAATFFDCFAQLFLPILTD